MLAKTFHLSLSIGPIEGVPVPREVIEALTSVTITRKSTDRSGFQLTFLASKNGLIQRTLLPSGYFEPLLTRVQIEVSIGATSTVLMDGLIARHELTASNDPGKSTLTITGEDVSLAMDQIDLTGIPYPCMPAHIVVMSIIARYAEFGMIPEVMPSVMLEIPNPLDKIPSQKGNDLQYIKWLADQVGYVFYVDPIGPGMNRAYWGPEIRYGPVQPALTVNSDALNNVESLSFSFDGTGATIYYIEAQIPGLCNAVPIPIPDVGLLRPPLAAVRAIPFRLEKIEDTMKKGPIAAALVALAKVSRTGDSVTGNGTLNVLRYGQILTARSLVDVRGAGRAYDGTYYVKSVTHNIKRGEYKQSFSLAREGLVPLQDRVQV